MPQYQITLLIWGKKKCVMCFSPLSFHRGIVTALNPGGIVLVLLPISPGGVQEQKRANVKKKKKIPTSSLPFDLFREEKQSLMWRQHRERSCARKRHRGEQEGAKLKKSAFI